MKLLVLHDANGKIVSVTEVRPSPGKGVGVVAPKGHAVLELDKAGELKDLHVVDIHKRYAVDVKAKRLVKQAG